MLVNKEDNDFVSIRTDLRGIGYITSLVFNPNDDCFYGCNATSNTITKIKGINF